MCVYQFQLVFFHINWLGIGYYLKLYSLPFPKTSDGSNHTANTNDLIAMSTLTCIKPMETTSYKTFIAILQCQVHCVINQVNNEKIIKEEKKVKRKTNSEEKKKRKKEENGRKEKKERLKKTSKDARQISIERKAPVFLANGNPVRPETILLSGCATEVISPIPDLK